MSNTLLTERLVFEVLVQLAVIVAAARLGGWLLARAGQPQVVGEIAVGVLLGPSCLGRLSPELFGAIFTGRTEPVFLILGQLGLVLLMFLVGLEVEFGHLRQLGATAAGVALAGLVLPFVLGLGLATAIHPHVAPEFHRGGFARFMATAQSITAVPILGRILMDFDLTRSSLGVLTLSAAAVDDVLGWMLLAAVSASVAGAFELWAVARMLGLTLAFVALMALLVRPLLCGWSDRVLARQSGFGLIPMSIILLAVIGSALITGAIGIFAIFGPFVLGAALSDRHELHRALSQRLQDVVNALFLPVFFTYTGLRTDVRLLDSGLLWGVCGLVILTAIAGKVVGCGLVARLGGMSWRDSAAVATLMNTRALMGLVVINVGRDLGVIPDSVFGMLVIMALVTTFMASPILRSLTRAS